uniref:Uncharacterized protein n=1 Tax=Rhizophora mucronata TaxID=61149 RepID=A0A2P2QQL4_RHIMU
MAHKGFHNLLFSSNLPFLVQGGHK